MLVFRQKRHAIDHDDQWRGVPRRASGSSASSSRCSSACGKDGRARLPDPRVSLAAQAIDLEVLR
jgi:hypothetical protein